MGVARDEGEVRRVTYLAKRISGVVGVESHMRVPDPFVAALGPPGGEG